MIDWFLHLTRGDRLIPIYTLERWLIDYYTLREVIDWFLHLTRGEWLIHIPYKRWSIDSYPRGDWLISTPYEMWLIDYYTLRELIDCYNYYRHLIDSYTPFERLLIDSYTLREVIDWFLYLKRGDWLIPIPNERWLIDSYTPARGVWSNLQVYLDDTYSEKSVNIIHTLRLKICNHNYFSYHLVPWEA